jgi:hypothetical protein
MEKQQTLFSRAREAVGEGSLKIRSLPLGTSLFILVLAGCAVLGGVPLYKTLQKSSIERMVAQYLRLLAKRGYPKSPGEGLEEQAKGIEDGELGAKALCFVRSFEEIYYRDKAFTKEDLKRLREDLRELARYRRSPESKTQ